MFMRTMINNQERICVTSRGEEYSYGQLLKDSASLAKTLNGGLPLMGERVGILFQPSYEFLTAIYATWRLGGCPVPLCPSHPEAEMEYFLQESQATHLVLSPDFKEQVQPILTRHRGLTPYLVEPFLCDVSLARQRPLEDWECECVRLQDSDRGLILFTSGTTGPPKGVVSTHGNLRSQITVLLQAWEWSKNDRILNPLPLHHVHGLVNIVFCALASGATCEFAGKFDPKSVWDAFARQSKKLTLFMAVPTIYSKLIIYYESLKDKELQKQYSQGAHALRLMVSGSAALPQSVISKWEKITGHMLLERYGMTELGMAISNTIGRRVAGYVGSPLPGVECKIMDERTYEEVPEGEPGELWVRGPSVFSEYFNRPEATEQAFEDGFFKTGDIAVRERGMYKILGRASMDIIKSGGYKISALDIERVISEHENVEEVVVLGVPSETFGEKIAAVVTLVDPEQKLHLSSLRRFCSDKLAAYKIPTLLRVVEEIPRNAMRKVNKRQLREELFSPPQEGESS